MVKEKFKSLIRLLFHLSYKLCIKIGIASPTIVVRMDGGICSQMHQYLIGQIFKERGTNVEYELDFFKYNGKDINGVHVRNFDLLKAFPYLNFKSASSFKSHFYSLVYNYVGNYPYELSTNWVDLLPPRILSGYYADPSYLYYPLFQKVFHICSKDILDFENQHICTMIENHNSIAVHVRRGDLAEYNIAYGYPVTINYFVEAIKYIKEKTIDPVFYFFSDDRNYVEQELLPIIPVKIEYKIVQNGSEKGYIDLFLISMCKHQITSKGSLGKYGALLGMNKEKMVLVSKDDTQTFMFDNAPCLKIII